MEEKGTLRTFTACRLLLDMSGHKVTGTLAFVRGEEEKIFHLMQGRIAGCASNIEADEPQQLLVKRKNPAALALVSLKNDPAFDPFMPLALVENGLLSLEELLSLLRESAVDMVMEVCAWEKGTYHFMPKHPQSAVFLNMPIPPLVLRFLSEKAESGLMLNELGSETAVLVSSQLAGEAKQLHLGRFQATLIADFAAGEKLANILSRHAQEKSALAETFILFLCGLLQVKETKPDSVPEPETAPEKKKSSLLRFFPRRGRE